MVSNIFFFGIFTPIFWRKTYFQPAPEILIKVHPGTNFPTRSGTVDDVDGSEIWRSPADMVNIPNLQSFSTIPDGCLGFLPATVCYKFIGIPGRLKLYPMSS